MFLKRSNLLFLFSMLASQALTAAPLVGPREATSNEKQIQENYEALLDAEKRKVSYLRRKLSKLQEKFNNVAPPKLKIDARTARGLRKVKAKNLEKKGLVNRARPWDTSSFQPKGKFVEAYYFGKVPKQDRKKLKKLLARLQSKSQNFYLKTGKVLKFDLKNAFSSSDPKRIFANLRGQLEKSKKLTRFVMEGAGPNSKLASDLKSVTISDNPISDLAKGNIAIYARTPGLFNPDELNKKFTSKEQTQKRYNREVAATAKSLLAAQELLKKTYSSSRRVAQTESCNNDQVDSSVRKPSTPASWLDLERSEDSGDSANQ